MVCGYRWSLLLVERVGFVSPSTGLRPWRRPLVSLVLRVAKLSCACVAVAGRSAAVGLVGRARKLSPSRRPAVGVASAGSSFSDSSGVATSVVYFLLLKIDEVGETSRVVKCDTVVATRGNGPSLFCSSIGPRCIPILRTWGLLLRRKRGLSRVARNANSLAGTYRPAAASVVVLYLCDDALGRVSFLLRAHEVVLLHLAERFLAGGARGWAPVFHAALRV